LGACGFGNVPVGSPLDLEASWIDRFANSASSWS
jgi:hypothetical protein